MQFNATLMPSGEEIRTASGALARGLGERMKGRKEQSIEKFDQPGCQTEPAIGMATTEQRLRVVSACLGCI